MKKLTGMAVVAFGLLLMGAAQPAQAQCGAVGYGGIGGYGLLGLNGSAYRSGRVPTPPYFALHPPVYYSQPMHRTYGYSPFAYPGTVKTPEAPPKAAMISNPHVQPVKQDAKPKLNLQNLTQLEVSNPFFMPATKMVSVEK